MKINPESEWGKWITSSLPPADLLSHAAAEDLHRNQLAYIIHLGKRNKGIGIC